jgi:DNA-directed RNA polymerase specialized sigma24 family protein
VTTRMAVVAAVSRLPRRQREAFGLHYLSDLS